MKYSRIIQAIFTAAWAIMPEKLNAIIEFIEIKAAGGAISDQTIAGIRADNREREASRSGAQAARPGSVAVIPLVGVISHRVNIMDDISGGGGASLEMFKARLQAAIDDPNIKSIVIDIDSPGGTVDGVPEVSDLIYGAREKKPIIAVANALCASAAYWIGSAASEFVCTPSGMVGSIGVITAHTDISGLEEKNGIKTTLIAAGKYKAEGSSYEPLNDDARAAIQSVVDEYYGQFVAAVARNRGVEREAVAGGFGEGRAVTARQALREKMIDKIATLDETVARVAKRTPPVRKMAAELDLYELS